MKCMDCGWYRGIRAAGKEGLCGRFCCEVEADTEEVDCE
jgi:hypothetical protein